MCANVGLFFSWKKGMELKVDSLRRRITENLELKLIRYRELFFSVQLEFIRSNNEYIKMFYSLSVLIISY